MTSRDPAIFSLTSMGSVLASARRTHLITIANGIGALVNVVLCLALIPYFQQDGAALAFTTAYLVLVAGTFYFLRTKVFEIDIVDILFKPLIAAGGMGAVLMLFVGMNLFVLIALGVVVYFGLIYVLKAIDHDDVNILTKVLKKT